MSYDIQVIKMAVVTIPCKMWMLSNDVDEKYLIFQPIKQHSEISIVLYYFSKRKILPTHYVHCNSDYLHDGTKQQTVSVGTVHTKCD